jgi:predicted enzyme related to lactoylglutathione lyase
MRGRNPIAHVEIPVRDLERAMAFYRQVLGVAFGPVVDLHGSRMAHFPFEDGQDGASAALAQGDVYVPTLDGMIVYFTVEDIDATLARAEAVGSAVLFAKTALDGGGFVAEIADSEGNRIALQSPAPEDISRR